MYMQTYKDRYCFNFIIPFMLLKGKQQKMQTSQQWHKCSKCGKTLSSTFSLWRHNKKCKSNANPSINVTTTKICEKKMRKKQPHSNEIIHFSSDELNLKQWKH